MSGSIYLTGSTGFLGRSLVHHLVEQRPERLVLPIRDKAKKGTLYEAAARHKELFSTYGDRTQHVSIDAPIPLDAKAVVLNAYDVRFRGAIDATLRDNVEPVLALLEQCRRLPQLERIVILSTAYVNPPLPARYYDGLVPIRAAADEESIEQLYEDALQGKLTLEDLGPLADDAHFTANPYICSKRIMEHMVCLRFSDLPITIVRPSQISLSRDGQYGLGNAGALLAARLAMAPFPKILCDSGEHDFVHVDEVSRKIIAHLVVDACPALKKEVQFVPLTSGDTVKGSHLINVVNPRRWTVWTEDLAAPWIKWARLVEWAIVCSLFGSSPARLVGSVYDSYDYITENAWAFPRSIPIESPEAYCRLAARWAQEDARGRTKKRPPLSQGLIGLLSLMLAVFLTYLAAHAVP